MVQRPFEGFGDKITARIVGMNGQLDPDTVELWADNWVETYSRNSKILGLRVAGTIFGIVAILHLLRVVRRYVAAQV